MCLFILIHLLFFVHVCVLRFPKFPPFLCPSVRPSVNLLITSDPRGIGVPVNLLHVDHKLLAVHEVPVAVGAADCVKAAHVDGVLWVRETRLAIGMKNFTTATNLLLQRRLGPYAYTSCAPSAARHSWTVSDTEDNWQRWGHRPGQRAVGERYHGGEVLSVSTENVSFSSIPRHSLYTFTHLFSFHSPFFSLSPTLKSQSYFSFHHLFLSVHQNLPFLNPLS